MHPKIYCTVTKAAPKYVCHEPDWPPVALYPAVKIKTPNLTIIAKLREFLSDYYRQRVFIGFLSTKFFLLSYYRLTIVLCPVLRTGYKNLAASCPVAGVFIGFLSLLGRVLHFWEPVSTAT
jgi:hypothetical protein